MTFNEKICHQNTDIQNALRFSISNCPIFVHAVKK